MILHVLDKTVKIEIDSDNHIGAMLSGGMDSALMLYIMLKEKPLTTKLTVFNVPNPKDNAGYFSTKIASFLEKKLNHPIPVQHIGNTTLPHNVIINHAGKYILENKLVDILYVGMNQNPPVTLPATGPWRRNPTDPIPKNLAFPFIDLYKTHILEIYKQLDILELADITHSCTENVGKRCNICFQCHERAWAYRELGLVDNGI
jgi:7-cyano-7-deazaguanine synthase in queuosine biosynthesis